MNITDVNVTVIENSKVKAIVTIVIDNAVAIHSIRLFEKDGKIVMSMPTRKRKDGQWSDFVHPINAESRAQIEEAIFAEYNKKLAENAKVEATVAED